MAETYHVFDIESVPLPLLRTLAAGLPYNSRTRTKLSGIQYPLDLLIEASISDKLSILLWRQTENGQKGIHPPRMLYDVLTGGETKPGDAAIMTYESPEAFEAARAKILEREKNGG